ncbi:MAG: cell wall hydrolase [Minisyncoccia bacterium]
MREAFRGEKIQRFLNNESSDASPEAVKKALRAAALGAGVIAGASTALPTPVEAGAVQVELQRQMLSEIDIDYLAQNVYHEARGESLEGQLAVAQVTLARLLSGKFGTKLTDVVFAPNQFSWTKDPHILMARMDDDAFANMKTRLEFTTGGKSLNQATLSLAEETELPLNAYYYKRTDWDENNPEEKRMSEKTKKMFQKLTKVREIGKHTFYTD